MTQRRPRRESKRDKYDYHVLYCTQVGRNSSVGIATHYGLKGSGTASRLGARYSAAVQTGPGVHLAPAQWIPGLYPRNRAVRVWR